MADKQKRNPANAAGPFYVDLDCIDCDLCRETAPLIFRRDEVRGLSMVIHQPVTSEEWVQARDAMASCPTENIGDDGEEGRVDAS